MIRLEFALPLLVFSTSLSLARAAEPDWEWTPATKHWNDIETIRWSPDGSKILTSGQDQRLIIWEAKTGRQLRSIAATSATAAERATWSGDGARVLAGPRDYKMTLWDVVSGKRLRTLYGPSFSVICGCLNRDGSLGVLGTARGTVLVWDPKTGEIVQTLSGHAKAISSIGITNDGTTAITGSEDATAVVWDVAASKPIATLKGHKGRIRTVALTQDGKTAITTSEDRSTIIWDARSGTPRHTLGGNFDPVARLECSDDGNVVLTGDSLSIRLWDGKTGKKTGSIDLKGHTSAIGLSPDGTKYALARGSELGVWDVKTGERLPIDFGTNGAVLCLAWHPKQPKLLVGSDTHHAMIWSFDAATKHQPLVGHRGPVKAASWDQEGKRLLTGDDGHAATLWDAETLQRLKSFPVGHWGVAAVSLNRDGSQALVVGEIEESAVLWDCKKAEKIRALRGPNHLQSAQWSLDGSRMFTSGRDSTIKVWDARNGQLEKAIGGSRDWVNNAAFSHDGTRIAVCYSSFQTSITYIWEVTTGKRLRTFEEHADQVTHVCWNADSTQLATGSRDKTIILWDVQSGKKLQTLKGHEAAITSLGWSPKGKFFASGSRDGSARIWDVKTGTEVCRLLTFASGKEWLVLGRDGAYDGSDGVKKQPLFRRRGSAEFVEADQYLRKPTAGLLAQLLAP
ncbi:MAG TPA: WD40 repeat domain-containing protein [Gemmataceae bacterium]|nr:WD40 repeat domain-containing protein [Gemmataceae bacterium]